ncbi:Uncharacterised protein [Mycobacteroides abscessus subsp. abscessus]|uniref:hypothetical protein n=2 Tax=Mycobacteroides abscessus TaxID=36809 RepID=UPI0009A7E0A2|nr:hypothetical protein [Mycobacteroides abscessus]SKQ64391.1 Uncharacterised protein [Mycobacteroides abscessus subsp. abscessus]
MTFSERLAIFLIEHPRARRTLTVMGTVYALCGWALISAPTAAASTGAAVLGWTGMRDTDGVPLKDMFLSVVDTMEAVTNNGQEITWDPTTWIRWLGQAGGTGVSHGFLTSWLTIEASVIVFGAAISFWFLRFAMSNAYLLALAEVARPIHAAVNTLVNQMWLGPMALALCLIVAVHHHRAGRTGKAWSLAGNAAILTVLLLTIFRDPIDELTSDHGMLGMARFTGFQIAQSVHGGSYGGGNSLDGQLNALMSQLVSDTVRPMIQLMNFGMIVDNIPGCRQAWNTAIMAANGQGSGPAHAMSPDPTLTSPGTLRCNAPQALAHAQQLGANDFVLGALFILVGLFIGFFIWYVGISNLLVGAKATYYGIAVTPAFILGMTGWERAKKYANRAGSQLILHGAQAVIFTAFLAISTFGIAWGLGTRSFGTSELSVVPRLLLVAVGCIVALLVFRYIDKHFYTDSASTIAHTWQQAWHSGRDRARADYDDFQDGLDKARAMGDKARKWRSGSSDEDTAESVIADDVPGFDVVKPRPTRQLSEAAATRTSGAGAETAATGKAAEAATVAARTGTTAEAAGAAETAATALAPEIAVPAAAAAAVAQKVHKHHHDNDASDSPTSGNKQRPPRNTDQESSVTDWVPSYSDTNWAPVQDNLSMSPTSAARPSAKSGRHSAADHADSADQSRIQPDERQAPDISADPPLEFPSSQPRPTVRKGDRQ